MPISVECKPDIIYREMREQKFRCKFGVLSSQKTAEENKQWTKTFLVECDKSENYQKEDQSKKMTNKQTNK